MGVIFIKKNWTLFMCKRLKMASTFWRIEHLVVSGSGKLLILDFLYLCCVSKEHCLK